MSESELELSEDELYWLEGAAERGAGDQIAQSLGTAGALRELAAKLKAERERREAERAT